MSGLSSSCIISSGFLHVQRRYSGDAEGTGVAMSFVATGIITGVTFGPPLGGFLYIVAPAAPFLFLIVLIGLAAFLALKVRRAFNGAFTGHRSRTSIAPYVTLLLL